ncbi:MAG: DUF4339 domain-containing protein [Planctomycetes bacterium]|nr:DUF4339 domain-containing protein [Planctomycetota bacterium]
MSEEKCWCAQIGSERLGPLSTREMSAMLEAGTLGPDSVVWRRGMTEWVPLHEIPELRVAPAAGAGLPSPEDGKVRFLCGACGKKIKVPAAMAGRTGKCPGCGAPVVAPRESDSDARAVVFESGEMLAVPIEPLLGAAPSGAPARASAAGPLRFLPFVSIGLGAVSLVPCCAPFFVFGVAALGTGIAGLVLKAGKRGLCVGGTAMGGAGILFGIVMLVFGLASGSDEFPAPAGLSDEQREEWLKDSVVEGIVTSDGILYFINSLGYGQLLVVGPTHDQAKWLKEHVGQEVRIRGRVQGEVLFPFPED